MRYTSIDTAVEILKQNSIIAFPTETVYGIGANAFSKSACDKIYKIKKRPLTNPLIIHCKDLNQAKNIAIFTPISLDIARAFWPGPLTLLLNKKTDSDELYSKQDTICIRIPSHPIALEILNKFNLPIAAPSANISNFVSATSPEHVYNDFQDQIPIVYGEVGHGIESTIIDCRNSIPKILRHGAITLEQINEILPDIQTNKNIYNNQTNQSSPGQLLKHYSTKTRIEINKNSYNISDIKSVGIHFGHQAFKTKKDYNLSLSGSLQEAAQNLYNTMRLADIYALANNIKVIYIAEIPLKSIGFAINDKLSRASYKAKKN